MTSTDFELLAWAASGNDLLDRSRKLLVTARTEKVQQLAGRIPHTVLSLDSPLLLVFAGQYSAGKSTIMKALTGRDDIAVGAGITTEKAQTYEWDGVRCVDTPGVHTGLRPDHDEITYQSIADADLLIFVVTNELFDSHLAEHFRKLAIDGGKANEMMLVVNKMRRCAKGNTSEAQAVIREDIRKVLAPFSPEDFRTSFIDAEAALDSKTEGDEELAKVLRKKSGIEAFIYTLNRFVREKGLSGRYTTSLYSLEQILQEALASESTGDTDIDALEELLLQRRRALIETQDRIPRAVNREIQQTGSQVRKEGRRIADMINGSADQKEINRELQAAQERVQSNAEQLGQTVRDVIGKQMEDFDERVAEIASGEVAKELLARLSHRIEEVNVAPETVSKLGKASEFSGKLGEFLVRNSFKSANSTISGLFRLNQYSGTAAHGTVKAIGHFFGKSFKPWEAVKWTRAVANAGRVLAVAGTALTVILQFKADADAVKLEKDLREGRLAVRTGFNDVAHEIEMHYDQATRSYVASTLTTEVEAVDKQLAELREMQKTRTDLFIGLVALLDEARCMIRDLHADMEKVNQ